jgi:hypothetical protein
MTDLLVSNAFSAESRRYAVRELARRAGVCDDIASRWRIELNDRYTSIHVEPGTPRRIDVPLGPPPALGHLADQPTRVARANWMRPPPRNVAVLIPDFILPFSSQTDGHISPLFSVVDQDSVACSHDILLATVLTLSRFEELASSKRDIHDRFESTTSIAVEKGFLNRPIIDEYGFAFAQALAQLLPAWKPSERVMRVKLSHDIDLIGVPFSLKATAGHTLQRHKPLATVRDILSLISKVEPAYLRCVRSTVDLAAKRGINSATYWQTGPPTAFDIGYDPHNSKVRRVIAGLAEQGVELGVHPSYSSFKAIDRLRQEVQTLRELFGIRQLGGRQHYLRWCPDVWVDWESCGLAYDSTVGYPDQIGFRAGTCIPYRPWLLKFNRAANLLEIPLLVMDVAMLDMNVTAPQFAELVQGVIARCRLIGGVFTLLWHNSTTLYPAYGNLYVELLNSLHGNPNYDWRWDAARLGLTA